MTNEEIRNYKNFMGNRKTLTTVSSVPKTAGRTTGSANCLVVSRTAGWTFTVKKRPDAWQSRQGKGNGLIKISY